METTWLSACTQEVNIFAGDKEGVFLVKKINNKILNTFQELSNVFI